MSPSPTPPPTLPTLSRPTSLPISDTHGMTMRHTSTGVVVTLHGEVDFAHGPALGAVRTLLTTWQEHPVVDASAVTFIDAAGLRAVMSLASQGTDLLVLAPSPAFCHLLHLLDLVGSSIHAVPADEGNSPPQPGDAADLPAGSVLVCDRGRSARGSRAVPTAEPAHTSMPMPTLPPTSAS